MQKDRDLEKVIEAWPYLPAWLRWKIFLKVKWYVFTTRWLLRSIDK